MEKRSSSVFRIDERVFYTMVVFSIVCLLILGFRYKNYESCEVINIEKFSSNFYTKSFISFKATTKGGKTFRWDFGDDSVSENSGHSIRHSFNKAGRYTVTLEVDDCKCGDVIFVDITNAPYVVNTELIPEISGVDTVMILKPVTFKSLTPKATSWEWRIDKSTDIESNSSEVSYTFTTEGDHQIYLRVNGQFDRLKEIYVRDPKPKTLAAGDIRPAGTGIPRKLPQIEDAPVTRPLADQTAVAPPEPKIKVVRLVEANELTNFLKKVTQGQAEGSAYEELLCEGMNTMVTLNDKPMKFSELCIELKKTNSNKYENPDGKLKTNKTTNCIISIDVTVEKRGLGERWLKKKH